MMFVSIRQIVTLLLLPLIICLSSCGFPVRDSTEEISESTQSTREQAHGMSTHSSDDEVLLTPETTYILTPSATAQQTLIAPTSTPTAPPDTQLTPTQSIPSEVDLPEVVESDVPWYLNESCPTSAETIPALQGYLHILIESYDDPNQSGAVTGFGRYRDDDGSYVYDLTNEQLMARPEGTLFFNGSSYAIELTHEPESDRGSYHFVEMETGDTFILESLPEIPLSREIRPYPDGISISSSLVSSDDHFQYTIWDWTEDLEQVETLPLQIVDIDPQTATWDLIPKAFSLPNVDFPVRKLGPYMGYLSISPTGTYALYTAMIDDALTLRLVQDDGQILWQGVSDFVGPRPIWITDSGQEVAIVFYKNQPLPNKRPIVEEIVEIQLDTNMATVTEIYVPSERAVSYIAPSPNNRFWHYATEFLADYHVYGTGFIFDRETKHILSICDPMTHFEYGIWISERYFAYTVRTFQEPEMYAQTPYEYRPINTRTELRLLDVDEWETVTLVKFEDWGRAVLLEDFTIYNILEHISE